MNCVVALVAFFWTALVRAQMLKPDQYDALNEFIMDIGASEGHTGCVSPEHHMQGARRRVVQVFKEAMHVKR